MSQYANEDTTVCPGMLMRVIEDTTVCPGMLMRVIEDTTVCPGMLMRIPQYVLVRYESDRGYHSISRYANEMIE